MLIILSLYTLNVQSFCSTVQINLILSRINVFLYGCIGQPDTMSLQTAYCLPSVWILPAAASAGRRCHSQEHLHNQQHRLRALHECRPAGEIRLPRPLLVSPASGSFHHSHKSSGSSLLFILVDLTVLLARLEGKVILFHFFMSVIIFFLLINEFNR